MALEQRLRRISNSEELVNELSYKYSRLQSYIQQSTGPSAIPESELMPILSTIFKYFEDTNELPLPATAINTGYTGVLKLGLGNTFVKVDAQSRLNTESDVYTILNQSSFSDLTPKLKRYSKISIPKTSHTFGVLFLDNLNPKSNPETLTILNSNIEYVARQVLQKHQSDTEDFETDFIEKCRVNPKLYYLSLMALFHSSMNKSYSKFKLTPYAKLNGKSHYQSSVVPFHENNRFGIGLLRYKESILDPILIRPVGKLRNSIDRYRKAQVKSKTIVHGDFKAENVPFGFLVDHSQVGIGFETDDLTYFLIDQGIDSIAEMHEYFQDYIKIRNTIDDSFRPEYGKLLTELLPFSALLHFVLKHSVMEKRDLTNDKHYANRVKYKHNIEKLCAQLNIYH